MRRIDYMELLFTADALAIARQRQSKILDLLRQATGPSSPGVGGEAPPSATDLYQQGLRLAELEEMAEDHNSSSEALTSLEAALPTYLGDDDRLRIAALRRRHDLLGHPLMELSPITSLRRPAVLPQIPARGAVTALLLFPDWCSQCIGLARPDARDCLHRHGSRGICLWTVSVDRRCPRRRCTRRPKGPLLQQTLTTHLSPRSTCRRPQPSPYLHAYWRPST